MACRPGEENVAILYGDVHYFYGPPTDNPPHHRFDKESYVYLFEDANQGRARLEIANHPGTDDQDAFDGYLDKVHLRYSYKHVCMVTLTVGEVEGTEEWHLPTYDPHNQNKYHYKLHSLDIYFWTPQDAVQFVNAIRRVLPPNQCEILDEPAPPPRHDTEVSSVVQRLEQAAISSSNAEEPPSITTTAPAAATTTTAPPPPPGPPPAQQFAPIAAYNPAAPPAPEQVRPREKTPPPPDDGVANPLQQTLAYDAQTPFSPGLPPSALGPSMTSPLSPALVPPPSFGPPPGAPSFPGPPTQSVASPGFAPQGFGSLSAAAAPGAGPSSAPPPHPGITRAATMPVSPGFASPLASPGLASPYGGVGTFPPTTQPGYAPQPQPQQPAGSEYSVHQQFYVPESQYKPKEEKKGKLEEKAGKLEKGITGLLKKAEKKFG
ncbi:hypothetical protein VTJ04DRAFT_1390 [Mycothermus thermophilus]|uniref:uncharacterized protein n=1 Tax=Humicola insolens TaxID=85995 RepID=UPI003741ECD6